MKGFTILEVLISTAVASLISVALFIALRQTMQFQVTTDAYVDVHTRAAIIQNQLERDFMGFFTPWQAYELTSTKTTAQSAQKEKPAQIDKIFYATKNKEQFGELSFITTNAMQVYWGATMGAPKPLVARVRYALVKDPTHEGLGQKENSYILQRQESADLDYARFEGTGEKKKVRAYDIVNDVKEMKVTYLARVYKEGSSIDPFNPSGGTSERTEKEKTDNKKNSSPSVRPERAKEQNGTKKLPTWTYKELTEWDWSPKKAKPKESASAPKDASKDTEKKKTETVSRVPYYMIVDIVLWDVEHTRETPFRFVFARKPFELSESETDTVPQSKKAESAAPVGMPDLSKALELLGVPKPTASKGAVNKNPVVANNMKPGMRK